MSVAGLGGFVKPVANLAEKASKAQKIKSVKVKVKFGDKGKQNAK